MTKNEIARYLALGRTKSVCVDVSLPERYPGLTRMVHLCYPSKVVVCFEPQRAEGEPDPTAVRRGEIRCWGHFADLDLAVASIEGFLSTPISKWKNFTASGFLFEGADCSDGGIAGLLGDIAENSVDLPEGADFEFEGGFLEDQSYWQPRVMRHNRPGEPTEFAIHDVYFDGAGRVTGYTIHARSDRAKSLKALRRGIVDQLSEAETGVVCGNLGYRHFAHDHHRHWLQHIDDGVIEYEYDDEQEAS